MNKIFNKFKNGTDSFKELLIIYVVVVTIVVALFAFFESKTIIESLWWTFVTGLTIGYGDIYPHTLHGQILAVIWGHFMNFLFTPLLVARLIIVTIDNKNEFTHEEQEEIKNGISSVLKEIKSLKSKK